MQVLYLVLHVEIPQEDIETRSNELQEIIQSLEEKEERWLELSMKLEEVSSAGV